MLVPAPALVQVACGSHPPLFVAHELVGAHTVPLPEYPALHAHIALSGPAEVHTAVVAQPPLATAHASTPVQVLPSPV